MSHSPQSRTESNRTKASPDGTCLIANETLNERLSALLIVLWSPHSRSLLDPCSISASYLGGVSWGKEQQKTLATMSFLSDLTKEFGNLSTSLGDKNDKDQGNEPGKFRSLFLFTRSVDRVRSNHMVGNT